MDDPMGLSAWTLLFVHCTDARTDGSVRPHMSDDAVFGLMDHFL
jgi:hypothetical protein